MVRGMNIPPPASFPEVDAVVTILALADGSLSESEIAQWLKANHKVLS